MGVPSQGGGVDIPWGYPYSYGMALFIMACSAAKHTGVLPAVVKYDSRQHRALYREFFLNGAFCSHDALILSTKYGFLPLMSPVEDYDLLMDDESAAALVASNEARTTIIKALDEQDTVYLYGGRLYRDAVKAILSAVGFQGEVVDVVGPDRGCCDHFSALQGIFYGMSADA